MNVRINGVVHAAKRQIEFGTTLCQIAYGTHPVWHYPGTNVKGADAVDNDVDCMACLVQRDQQ